MSNVIEGSFLEIDSKNFLCQEPTMKCPSVCTCYRNIDLAGMLVDCRNRSLNYFPKNIELPSEMIELTVSLEHNHVVNLPLCGQFGYNWLKNVTHLNVQHNELTPEPGKMKQFLQCMSKISYLYLANNNIKHLPQYIQNVDLQAMSITGNKLSCCNDYWMKTWLQVGLKQGTILDSSTVQCADKGDVNEYF